MWIKGTDALIQTDELRLVDVGMVGDGYILAGEYRTGGYGSMFPTIEVFDDRDAANAAKDWFYLLLTGEIDKEQWEQGRTDAEAREGIFERKAVKKRRGEMFPKSPLDQDAHLAALYVAGREFIEYYEDVLAPDCEKFWELLRVFRKGHIKMDWPAPDAQKRLVEIFEKATGIEYDGDLNT